MNNHPELDKIHAVQSDSQVIGAFLEWLQQNYELMEWNARKERYYHMSWTVNGLLAKYFGIDEDKAEQERKMILEELQK